MDENSFLTLYREHKAPLYRFAWRLTGSEESAADIVQEAFLALLAGGSYDSTRGPVRPYLFGIARNLSLKRLRDSAKEGERAEDIQAADRPLDDLLATERGEAVARAVSRLPIGQREALILFEYEELSLEEIASAMGIPVGAVKARLHRARETLRSRLAPWVQAGERGKRL